MKKTAAKCSIKQSPIHGRGLFADQAIAEGEEILKISGTLKSTDSLDDQFLAEGHWQGVAAGWCLVTEEPTSFAYVNHRPDPNAFVNLEAMSLMALSAIMPGEEVTIDYGKEPMDERCRRLIGELGKGG